jgi:hypothetical protein
MARENGFTDEQVLHMVRLRHAGISSYGIAKQMCLTAAQVRVQTNLVKDADLAESKEPRHLVLPFYPNGGTA